MTAYSKNKNPSSDEIMLAMVKDMPAEALRAVLPLAVFAVAAISKGEIDPPPANGPSEHLMNMLDALGIKCEVKVRDAKTGEDIKTLSSQPEVSEGAKMLIKSLEKEGKLSGIISDVAKSVSKHSGDGKSPEEIDDLSAKLHKKVLDSLGEDKDKVGQHAAANLAGENPRGELLKMFVQLPEDVKSKMIEAACDALSNISQGGDVPPAGSGGDFFIGLMKASAKSCGHVVIDITDDDLSSPEAIDKAAKAAAEAIQSAAATKH